MRHRRESIGELVGMRTAAQAELEQLEADRAQLQQRLAAAAARRAEVEAALTAVVAEVAAEEAGVAAVEGRRDGAQKRIRDVNEWIEGGKQENKRKGKKAKLLRHLERAGCVLEEQVKAFPSWFSEMLREMGYEVFNPDEGEPPSNAFAGAAMVHRLEAIAFGAGATMMDLVDWHRFQIGKWLDDLGYRCIIPRVADLAVVPVGANA